MTSITTRAGKGSPLTHNEVDANFTNLNNDKLDTAGIALGSAASPTLKFTSDPNTGIYSPGADQLAVATNGTGRLFINATGNVGVGTSAPISTAGYGGVTMNGADGSILSMMQGGSETFRVTNATGYSFINTTGATPILFGTAAIERLRIDSSGRVGIGTSSPGYALDVAAADTTASTGYAVRIRANATAGAGALQFTDSAATAQYGLLVFGANGVGTLQADGALSRLVFSTNAAERLRIDSSGRLLVGTSVERSNFFNTTITANILLENDNAVLGVVRNGNNAFSPYLVLAKSRSASNTIVQANDQLGSVNFQGNDGTEFVEAAQISAEVDGTPGANDMPGRLVFSVTADGAASPTEALRIKSTRIVNIANTPVHADNAAAKTAGLVDGDVYRKSDGTMMIVFT